MDPNTSQRNEEKGEPLGFMDSCKPWKGGWWNDERQDEARTLDRKNENTNEELTEGKTPKSKSTITIKLKNVQSIKNSGRSCEDAFLEHLGRTNEKWHRCLVTETWREEAEEQFESENESDEDQPDKNKKPAKTKKKNF